MSKSGHGIPVGRTLLVVALAALALFVLHNIVVGASSATKHPAIPAAKRAPPAKNWWCFEVHGGPPFAPCFRKRKMCEAMKQSALLGTPPLKSGPCKPREMAWVGRGDGRTKAFARRVSCQDTATNCKAVYGKPEDDTTASQERRGAPAQTAMAPDRASLPAIDPAMVLARKPKAAMAYLKRIGGTCDKSSLPDMLYRFNGTKLAVFLYRREGIVMQMTAMDGALRPNGGNSQNGPSAAEIAATLGGLRDGPLTVNHHRFRVSVDSKLHQVEIATSELPNRRLSARRLLGATRRQMRRILRGASVPEGVQDGTLFDLKRDKLTLNVDYDAKSHVQQLMIDFGSDGIDVARQRAEVMRWLGLPARATEVTVHGRRYVISTSAGLMFQRRYP